MTAPCRRRVATSDLTVAACAVPHGDPDKAWAHERARWRLLNRYAGTIHGPRNHGPGSWPGNHGPGSWRRRWTRAIRRPRRGSWPSATPTAPSTLPMGRFNQQEGDWQRQRNDNACAVTRGVRHGRSPKRQPDQTVHFSGYLIFIFAKSVAPRLSLQSQRCSANLPPDFAVSNRTIDRINKTAIWEVCH
jgi:hypothetical protein